MNDFSENGDRPVPFLLAPLMVLAAAIRIAVNNVVAFSRADETVYLIYTKMLAGGAGYPRVVRTFLDDPGMWVLPNPVRWSWLGATTLACSVSKECTHQTLATLSTIAGIAAVALTYWIARELFDETSALAAAAFVATSPLQLALGRRALADEFFCAVVLASLVALLVYVRSGQSRRRWLWLGAWIVMTTIVIAAKEQSLFVYPFVLWFWWRRARRVRWHDVAAWLAPPILFFGVFCILARDTTSFFRIVRTITSVIRAPYAEQFQSGPAHRLLIDLLAVAPIVTMIAIAAAISIVLRRSAFAMELRDVAILACSTIAVYAVVPSQNVRYIVSADPLLRVLVAAFLVAEVHQRKWLLPLLLVNAIVELKLFYDVFIVAQVYDPVTDQLLRALRMLPR